MIDTELSLIFQSIFHLMCRLIVVRRPADAYSRLIYGSFFVETTEFLSKGHSRHRYYFCKPPTFMELIEKYLHKNRSECMLMGTVSVTAYNQLKLSIISCTGTYRWGLKLIYYFNLLFENINSRLSRQWDNQKLFSFTDNWFNQKNFHREPDRNKKYWHCTYANFAWDNT